MVSYGSCLSKQCRQHAQSVPHPHVMATLLKRLSTVHTATDQTRTPKAPQRATEARASAVMQQGPWPSVRVWVGAGTGGPCQAPGCLPSREGGKAL